jgi:hypothetical protein
LWEKNWSEGLAKEAVWLSEAMSSFERAEEALAPIGRISMSDSTVWQRVDKWGEQFIEILWQLTLRSSVVRKKYKARNEQVRARLKILVHQNLSSINILTLSKNPWNFI